MTTADVHVKVDKNIKMKSEEILKKIGISLSDLVNMTLRRVVYERRIPFDTKIESREIPENMRIETKEDLINYVKKGLEKDNETYFTIEEVNDNIGRRRKELIGEKI